MLTAVGGKVAQGALSDSHRI